jgi:SPW repeat-containing protein
MSLVDLLTGRSVSRNLELTPKSGADEFGRLRIMKKWTRWQDWVAVAAGLYAALSTMWTVQAGASTSLMLVFGVLLIVAGLWNLAAPGLAAMEWIEAVLGALLFISPWIGGYAMQTGAAWTSWICGAIGIIVGLWAVQPATRMHHQRITPSH